MKKWGAILGGMLFGLISLMAFSGCDLLFGKSVVGTYKFNAVIRMGITGKEVVDGELKPIYEESGRRQIGDLVSDSCEEIYTENTYILELKENNTFLMVHPGDLSFFQREAFGTWKQDKNEITLTTTLGCIVLYRDENEKDVLCLDTYSWESSRDVYSILQLKKSAAPIEKAELKSTAGMYKFAFVTLEYGVENIKVSVGEKDGNGEIIMPEYLILDLHADGTCLAVGHRVLGLVDGKLGTWESTESGYRLLHILDVESMDFTVEGDLLIISFSEDGKNVTLTLSK